MVNTVNPLASLVSWIPLNITGLAVDVVASGRLAAGVADPGRLGATEGLGLTLADGFILADGLALAEEAGDVLAKLREV